MSALQDYTAKIAEAAERLHGAKDPAAISALIQQAVVGFDEKSVLAVDEAFGEDHEAMFRAWFTGRPGYEPNDWVLAIMLLAEFSFSAGPSGS